MKNILVILEIMQKFSLKIKLTLTLRKIMNKKLLFYKAIIWQIIGLIWISLLSYFWFGSWGKSKV